jgi:putative membrane protein
MVPGFEADPTSFMHAPGYIAGRVHQTLDRWNREGKLKDSLWILDQHARSLMDVSGACERIRTTPTPSSYRALLRIGMILYVLLAPWAVAMEIGWWAPLVTGVAMIFLIGLELIGETVEEPFGTDGDDLPLEAYCENIERFLRAALEDPSAFPAANHPTH